jgi:uncharacterized protein (DUF1015 family)
MARILPFQPYRYTAKAGLLPELVTQPYDKITPDMQERYLGLSPNNFVRLALGPRLDSDSPSDNVYTRAERTLSEWISNGILAQDPEPGFYPYFQEFQVPETSRKALRKGFIGLGQLEDYSAGVIFRHEQTLSGPKKDRLELLRRTNTHIEHIFLLYPDPEFAVERILDRASAEPSIACVTDEYGARHSLWRIRNPATTAEVTRLMAPKRLLIADGHHRYETALNFRNENPALPAARFMMMTFVNMHSPGLEILATHRLVSGLPKFNLEELLAKARESFRVERLHSLAALRQRWASPAPCQVRIGMAVAGTESVFALEKGRADGELDVALLHELLLKGALGIGEAAVREQKHLCYVRGLEAAVAEVQSGLAQIAFLLEPVSVDQVAAVSFSGGVMPQKSTDFYPKLLSGLTLYRM